MYEITRQKFVLVTGFLLFLLSTSLYLFFSPGLASQPWDSLEYAYAAEVKGITWVWGNHPLGHILFSLVFGLAKQLGYQGRALTIIQITNSLIGGLTVAIFFAALVSVIKVRPLVALGFSLILGASYTFWFFAGSGDVYHLAILFSLLAWIALAHELKVPKRRFLLLSGFFTGLSILSHQLNVVFIPVGMALILFAPNHENLAKRGKIEGISLFAASALVVAVLGFLMIGFIATSSFSLLRIIGWMRGYFGDPTYGRYLDIENFKAAWATISQALMLAPRDKAEAINHALLVFFFFIMLVGLFLQKALDWRKRAILKASALQCLITGLLIVWWEPQNSKFWLLLLSPFIIFLALSFEVVRINIRNRLPALGKRPGFTIHLMLLFLGVFILAMNIQHIDGKQDALAFQESLELWLSHSGSEDILLTAGDLVPQLRFWGKRPNTVNLYRSLQESQNSADDFSDLRAQIDQALCARRTVLITPEASTYLTEYELSLVDVSRDELRSFLEENARKGQVVFWYRNAIDGKLLPVYAVRRSVACLD
jgi:hypothetical protein